MSQLSARDRLIVALDFPSRHEAMAIRQTLTGQVGMFKVGKQLFTREGPSIVQQLIDYGEKIFLDLKFHDIPTTVAGAVSAAVSLRVNLVNVHALGGQAMMEAAAQAAAGSGTRVLAVTVLTSLGASQLCAVGLVEPPERLALRLGRLALEAGLDGIVAAPSEVAPLREQLGPAFVILTPGIRLPGAALHDQARVATPAQAVRNGADYIVVGRPITEASDPAAAARGIVAMLE